MGKDILSKSTFIRSIQCQKSLYLYKRHKELRDEISAEQQAIFARGHSVGFLARSLFPGGVDVGWQNPRFYNKAVERTLRCIANGTKVIYEAAFLSDDILVAADILVRDGDEWHLYEVKSSLQPSETFLRDAALQYRVITRAGINLTGVSLVHLNRHYLRGDSLDLTGLFAISDVTEQVKFRQAYVLSGIVAARETLRYKETPEVPIGPHCHSPYPCDFLEHCWKKIPPASIFNISALEPERKWKLYNQGIIMLSEVPERFPLTKHQQVQYDALLHGKVHLDGVAINRLLGRIKFPAIFADFNTARPGIPIIKNSKPYQQIPFQFSSLRLSHIAAPPVEHHFIADADPSVTGQFLRNWIKMIENVQTIIVFDKQQELYIFKDLASAFPENAEILNEMQKKVIDLSEITRAAMFYHPGMQGNADISNILAALGAEPDENPEIKNKYMAGIAFEGCFAAPDLFYTANIKSMLSRFSLAQSRMLYSLFANIREQALAVQA
jgi:hypothetical protein